jgi:hypothetical protein
MTETQNQQNSEETQVERVEALTPAFTTPVVNEPVLLYEDQVTVVLKDQSLAAKGRIFFDWLPTPAIKFKVADLQHGTLLSPTTEHASLSLSDGTLINDCLVTGLQLGGVSEEISGLINECVHVGPNFEVAEARFVVSNIPVILGSAIAFPDGSLHRGRLRLQAQGWNITLDPVYNHRDLIKDIKACSGYGITYSGSISKVDGSLFNAVDSEDFINAFSLYSSFAFGRWVAALFLQGVDSSGHAVWQRWTNRRIDPYRHRESWLEHQFANIYQDPFIGFSALWVDPDWREAVSIAICWYLSANALSGDIEGAIVQTQTAFELLSSVVLVEMNASLSASKYRNENAASLTRMLLGWASIPTSIPSSLVNLSSRASAESWSDTAAAMTAIRNVITHPTRANRLRFAANSFETRIEAWKLGLWNLELCILRLFDYNGMYANRLTQAWPGQTETVPWAI